MRIAGAVHRSYSGSATDQMANVQRQINEINERLDTMPESQGNPKRNELLDAVASHPFVTVGIVLAVIALVTVVVVSIVTRKK
jgi:hypothetical protein